MKRCAAHRLRLFLWSALLAVPLLISSGPGAAQPAADASPHGLITLDEGALAYIPGSSDRRPASLLILLHGAGGAPREIIDRFRAAAETERIVLLAPRSAGRTWDLILAAAAARHDRGEGNRDTFSVAGGDSARIETALERLRARVEVDPARVALAGFSDGASYALSIGPARPELYNAILAFSPGFAARPAGARGRQPVFVTHGRADRVLDFARSRDAVLPSLREAGHRVVYLPFAGGHTITDASIAAALRFLVDAHAADRPVQPST